MATLTISIDRSGMAGAPAPLVLSGHDDAAALHVVRFQPPARLRRTTYAADSAYTHSSEKIASALQQGILGFHFVADVATETALQVAIAEVEAALDQWSYTVTTTINGAPPKVWACDEGSIQIAGDGERDFYNLTNVDPVYAVSIPVYPIPGA